jgi:predicted nucleic-acid-binding protein
MATLDTNVLVRYLVKEDGVQFAAAKKLIQTALSSGQRLYIPITVMLELEWVLRSVFDFDKEQLSNTLASLLAAAELTIESEHAVEIALALYKKNSADFADCVHIALSHLAGEAPLWTFDRSASKISGAELLAV